MHRAGSQPSRNLLDLAPFLCNLEGALLSWARRSQDVGEGSPKSSQTQTALLSPYPTSSPTTATYCLTCQELEPLSPTSIHRTLGDPHPLFQPHSHQSQADTHRNPDTHRSISPQPKQGTCPPTPATNPLPTLTCPSSLGTRPPHKLSWVSWGRGSGEGPPGEG